MQTTQPRLKFIDIAKGSTILLVTMNHNSYLKNVIGMPIFSALALVRLPFFFFLSGLFLNFTKPGLAKKKFDALIVPYLLGSLLASILYGASTGEPLRQLIGVLYANGSSIINVPIWFLPHLFLATLTAWLMARVFKLRGGFTWRAGLWLAVQYSIGALLIGKVPAITIAGYRFLWLPWGLDFVLISSFFLLIGQLLRQHIFTFLVNPGLLAAAGVCFLLVVTFSGARLDLDQRHLVQPAAVLLGALCGIYLFLCLAKALTRFKPLAEMFSFSGRASLVTLIMHYPYWALSLEVFSRSFREQHQGLVGVFSFVVSIGLSWLTYSALYRSPDIWQWVLGWARRDDPQPAQ